MEKRGIYWYIHNSTSLGTLSSAGLGAAGTNVGLSVGACLGMFKCWCWHRWYHLWHLGGWETLGMACGGPGQGQQVGWGAYMLLCSPSPSPLLPALFSTPSPVSSVLLPPPLVSSHGVGARWWWWQQQQTMAVLMKISPAQCGWDHLATTNCCHEVLWGSRLSNQSTHV